MEADSQREGEVARLASGIEGLDHILEGGFPEGRSLLVVGSSGSGKTLLTLQCIAHQVAHKGKDCIFVTFEERPKDILLNTRSLGWDLARHYEQGHLHFVDATPDLDVFSQGGEFDLSGLLSQLRSLIKKHGVEFVVFDSLGGLFYHYHSQEVIRRELFRIVEELRACRVTSLVTAERLTEYGDVSRFGVEEFVTDGVLVLRHTLSEEKIRRTVQVHKLRGCSHHQGEFPFTITNHGLSITPLSMMQLKQSSSNVRVPFGNSTFDEMTGGGLFNDSVMLISGPTGVGKTLLCSTFVAGGCERGENCLFLSFEESRPQLSRNASSWGYNFAKWEAESLLMVDSIYPEIQSLEEHFGRIRRLIETFKPRRLVIDSLSALERVGSVRVFREFVIGLTALVKQNNVCSVFTSTSPKLSGGDSITDTHISTITDTIVLLRYVEKQAALHRGAMVIKMRGSAHDRDFREFTIDKNGISIGPRSDRSGTVLGIAQE